jgi:uncharacterized protein (UPF0210 family)
MLGSFSTREILETIKMVQMEHLDIRTTTMGISLFDCISSSPEVTRDKIYEKVMRYAGNLVTVVNKIEDDFGIKVANKRISVTPVALTGGSGFTRDGFIEIAKVLDKACNEIGVDFLGGYSALVQKGATKIDEEFLKSIPEALTVTEHICSSVNVASTRAGINMDAVREMGILIKEMAEMTKERGALANAKFVVFSNAVEDNPFMAGAFHGVSEPECVINVGVSGPGVVNHAVKKAENLDLGQLAEVIKKTVYKITRAGELIGRETAKRLGVQFGILDLSLAPTPAEGDSVGEILQGIGLAQPGAPGTTAALSMLTDAVKKGGVMASSHVGGMSGAFIPVSEDGAMIEAVKMGALTLEKLEAMTSVCSVGLDMVAVPGDTTAETISGVIADEIAIGAVNGKTTAVRVIVPPGSKVGDEVNFGGLLGKAIVQDVNSYSCAKFIARGGRIPAVITSMRN